MFVLQNLSHVQHISIINVAVNSWIYSAFIIQLRWDAPSRRVVEEERKIIRTCSPAEWTRKKGRRNKTVRRSSKKREAEETGRERDGPLTREQL